MKDFMKLNLQYFADETVVEEVPEIDAPDDAGEVEEGIEPEVEEVENEEEIPLVQEPDANSIAASARRRAEEDYKRQIEARDLEFAKRFENLSNPLTGQPIRSERDYLAALDAQETINKRQELEARGIDPSYIDEAIASNPLIRQAQEVLKQAEERESQRLIDEHVKEITKLDSSVKSLGDITKQETFSQVMAMVTNGVDLVSAYKVVNFDRLRSNTSAAAQQAAINQARGKSHLNPANEISTPDGLVDIPANELESWKQVYPNLSVSEIKKKYNNTL